ncbi:MAG: hypothetical protein ACM359_25025, partial [Bacillota bacterium]
SCGCFGRLSIPPRYTLLLDLTLLLSLLLIRPPSRPFLPPPSPSPGTPGEGRGEGSLPRHPTLRNIFLLVSTLLLPLLLLPLRPSSASLLILDPPTWLNQRFPLLDHLDIAPELSTGQWSVLLYHHDCPNCQEVIPRDKNLSRRPAQKVAMIEIPPYGPPLPDPNPTYLSAKLPDSKEWFVTTPVELILKEGQVVQVTP